ncbi:hypothetical protein [uncultured Nitrospira sp.]|uniref:hypothetical protein n=1 Tax=uncultured Nitrospira sp. TaxID=157176 RepID=UPI003140C05E
MSRINVTSSSKFSIVSGVLGAMVFAFSGSLAHAGQECYDFSDLPVGSQYQRGDTVNAEHSVATLRQFYVSENQPSLQESQVAEVVSSNIPQGGAPSLKLYSINVQLTPTTPVQEIRLRFAENTGGAYIQNFEVNGQKRVLQGGLSQLHQTTTGNAKIHVTAAPGGGNFIVGTLEMRANQGTSIASFSIGGNSQFFIDDVCIKK